MIKKILLITLLILSQRLVSLEILVVDGSSTNGFAYDTSLSYYELSVWHKIAYLLNQHGASIRSIEDLPIDGYSRKTLREMYKDKKILYIDYRGHHPTIKNLSRIPKENLANLLMEPPTVFTTAYCKEVYDLFGTIFTFDETLIDHVKFHKFYYPSLTPMMSDIIPFDERKLCCTMIANKSSGYIGELYTERKRAISFFNSRHPTDFDLFGPGWDHAGFRTYRGVAQDKCAVMKHYKFAFAFENTRNVPGYISEKILDCFHAGVVPIYLGSPTIQNEIPSNCFIDMRNFSSYEELYKYLSSMTSETFESYIENIRTYLSSDNAKRFSGDHFAITIAGGLLGIPLTLEDLPAK